MSDSTNRPQAAHVRKALGAVVQPKSAAGRPVAAHVQRAMQRNAPIQPKRAGVVQRSFFRSDDYGSPQSGEFYLDEEKKKFEKWQKQEQLKKTNREDHAKHSYRFYDRTYSGTAGIIAEIIDRDMNSLSRTHYSRDLIDRVVSAMKSVIPPDDLSPKQLITTANDFRNRVMTEYTRAVKETDGKTDTQIGLTANYVNYK